MIDESDEKIENPEIMIFQIIELVSSTAYSAIINKEPVDVETLKPYLYQTIRTIIINHQSGDENISQSLVFDKSAARVSCKYGLWRLSAVWRSSAVHQQLYS